MRGKGVEFGKEVPGGSDLPRPAVLRGETSREDQEQAFGLGREAPGDPVQDTWN